MPDFFILTTLSGLTQCAIMHVAFGVFANAKIQCEESASSSTPQNCATTNRPPPAFEKHTSFSEVSMRFQAFVLINWLR